MFNRDDSECVRSLCVPFSNIYAFVQLNLNNHLDYCPDKIGQSGLLCVLFSYIYAFFKLYLNNF